MTTRIKLRRDSAANWESNNPILALGEAGYDTTNHQIRVGDGVTQWISLSPVGGVNVGNDGQIAIGSGAGIDGTGTNAIAIGTDAGVNQSWVAIAIGHEAGNTNQSGQAIAIGRLAGASGQGYNGIAIGRLAGATDQGNETVAIGRYAGNDTQGQHAVAVGAQAGELGQGWAAVAVGEEAGNEGQGFRAIAVGRWAGAYNQGDQSVAVGALAGKDSQGDYAIAIGRHAGEGFQSNYSIAIGQEAARGSNPGISENWVTANIVSGGLEGTYTVIVDSITDIHPGMGIVGPNINATILDVNTETFEITFDNAVSGGDATGSYIFSGSQGEYSIAIGAYASKVFQHNNSIVIDATGNTSVSAGTSTFVVKPVRDTGSLRGDFKPCFYNATTGELAFTTNAMMQGNIELNATTANVGLAITADQISSTMVITEENGYSDVQTHQVELPVTEGAESLGVGTEITIINLSQQTVGIVGWPGPPWIMNPFATVKLSLIGDSGTGKFWWLTSSFEWI